MLRIIAVLAMLLVVCAAPAQAQSPSLRATVELKDASGQSVGSITLAQEGDVVHLLGSLKGLPPGTHGIHFHEVGACSPDFAAAGAHYNPSGKEHGLENPAGAHAGDLANLVIAADGSGSYDHKTPLVTLAGGPTTLYDADGSSVIIHASADDYKSQPTGNSGGRIACGIVPAAQPITPAPAQPPAAQPAPAQPPAAGGPTTLPNTGVDLPHLPLLVSAAVALLIGSLLTRRRLIGDR